MTRMYRYQHHASLAARSKLATRKRPLGRQHMMRLIDDKPVSNT